MNHASAIDQNFDHVGANLRKGREYRGSNGILGA